MYLRQRVVEGISVAGSEIVSIAAHETVHLVPGIGANLHLVVVIQTQAAQHIISLYEKGKLNRVNPKRKCILHPKRSTKNLVLKSHPKKTITCN